ncbi:hypothetical protein JKP88DRAFT_240942 [Tribonema minus]|uniref:Uncharacterized protein n=1 Tax=Tribonema minus TaxID=303371 RepID=A0A836CK26_9STRA|nr:hypothetical protein JKP88DRAFT_240942 [Tribonema minus]
MSRQKQGPKTFDDVISNLGDSTQAILVTCDSTTEAMSRAAQIFQDDVNIKDTKVYGHHIVVNYVKSTYFSTRARQIGNGCVNIGRRQMLSLEKEMEPTHVNKRAVELDEEPEPISGHITVWLCGRWNQKPAEKYMLSLRVMNMRKNSKQRTHTFDEKAALIKLRDALIRLKNSSLCACGRPNCNIILRTYGEHSISPDRMFDNLGYSADHQILKIVAKEHNTAVKHDAVVRERVSQHNWLSTTGGSTSQSLKKMIAKLAKKKRRTPVEDAQLVRFKTKDQKEWNKHFQKVLIFKKKYCPNCALCGSELYYGDTHGKLRFSGRPNQASPDRIDNSNPFYDMDNVRMVCQSCNLSEKDYRRVSSENESTKQGPIPFVAARWIEAVNQRLEYL